MMGANKKCTDECVPSAIWSALEVGCIGLSEVKAREKYGDSIKSGKFPYLASGKALCEGDTNGFIKVIADPDGIIVGFHSIGKNASELLGLGGFLVQNHVSLSDVSDTVFAHPTLSEMIHEATLLAEGKPINI
jgi:dihydrolipoamide dehydrogenase